MVSGVLGLCRRLQLFVRNNFLSKVVRCGADMKKPRMGSTWMYVPFEGLIEAPQIAAFHKK